MRKSLPIKLFLSSLCFFWCLIAWNGLHGVVDAASGTVIEENDFVVIRTHESGTFVGVKQYIELDSAGTKKETSKASKSDNEESASDNNKRIYYAFKGIPYAKPPLGSLRWKDPQIYDVKDAGPKDTTKYGQICSQWSSSQQQVIGSQDCLHLNIFTPRLFFSTPATNAPATTAANYSKFDDDPRETKRHLPVLLYIHDGDFIVGSGNLPPSSEISFMRQDIILVTFNYRLGVFGFLSSGSSSLPGNYGLLDQIAVLKWLHKNVHRFGGNSNRITIFGNGQFLQLTPLASGLYERSILMQSTTSLTSSTSSLINSYPKDYFMKFTNAANCSVPNEILSLNASVPNPALDDIINDCLRNKHVEELIELQQSLYKFWRYPKYLRPTTDEGLREFGDVLPRKVLPLIPMLGLQENYSLMMGVNGISEGFELFYEFYKELALQNQTRFDRSLENEIKRKLQDCLALIIGERLARNERAFDGIWNYYFGGIVLDGDDDGRDVDVSEVTISAESLFSQLLQLFGDVTVYVPYSQLLENLREQESLKLFNYVFDPQLKISQNIVQYVRNRVIAEDSADDDDIDDNNGVSVADNFERNPWDEEYYLFLRQGNKSNSETPDLDSSDAEAVLSDIMVNIWVSFAAYENPKNAITKHKNWTRWARFGYDYNRLNQTSYYHIKQNVSQMKDNFKKKEAQFWLETLPTLYSMSETVEKLEDWPTLFWIFISLSCVLFLIVVAIIGYMYWSSKYS